MVGCIISDVSRDPQVFRVLQHQTSSPRRPCRRIWNHHPAFSAASVTGWMTLLLGTEDFAEWASCLTSASNFYWLVEGPPASIPTPLPAPGSCVSSHWPPQYALPRALWVPAWSYVLRPQSWWSCLVLQLPSQINMQLPVHGSVEKARCHFWVIKHLFAVSLFVTYNY